MYLLLSVQGAVSWAGPIKINGSLNYPLNKTRDGLKAVEEKFQLLRCLSMEARV